MTVLTTPPRQTTEPCVLHKWCIAKSIGNEEHHVLPQAWQLKWRPPASSGAAIWDQRKISCDPLGHRNIHHILVASMKVYEGFFWDEGEQEYEADAVLAHRMAVKDFRNQGLHVNPSESAWALEAMRRWLEAGGSLIDLCLAGEYGYA